MSETTDREDIKIHARAWQCYILAARIFEIREEGYNVKKESKTGKNRFGETVCYTEYRLQESTNA